MVLEIFWWWWYQTKGSLQMKFLEKFGILSQLRTMGRWGQATLSPRRWGQTTLRTARRWAQAAVRNGNAIWISEEILRTWHEKSWHAGIMRNLSIAAETSEKKDVQFCSPVPPRSSPCSSSSSPSSLPSHPSTYSCGCSTIRFLKIWIQTLQDCFVYLFAVFLRGLRQDADLHWCQEDKVLGGQLFYIREVFSKNFTPVGDWCYPQVPALLRLLTHATTSRIKTTMSVWICCRLWRRKKCFIK